MSLSNEGEIDRHPIHKLTERLEAAVTTGQVFFNVRFVPGEAATEKILVRKMFALGGFDFLCHPFTSIPQTTTQHVYSSTGEVAILMCCVHNIQIKVLPNLNSVISSSKFKDKFGVSSSQAALMIWFF